MHTPFLLRAAVAAALVGSFAGCGSDSPMVTVPTPQPPTPATPSTPGDTTVATSANRLVTFNRASPNLRTAVAITGLGASESVVGIDYRAGGTPAGELYALTNLGRVYVVSTAGVATLKATLSADPTDTTSPFTSLDGTEFGVDFNPVVDRLRVVSNTGQNLRINVDTGATITDTSLTAGASTATGITGAAYSNDFAAACRTTLYYYDSTADRVLSTADANTGVVTDIGALGVDGGAINGFDIVTAADGTNAGVMVASVAGVPTVLNIALATGVATSVGALTVLNPGESARGLAIAPLATTPTQAVGNAIAVTATNKVISFNTASPQKLCTSAALTGLQSGENVLGVDTRPADNQQYALGSSGRLYTVNATSGVATLKSTLAADATDSTAPFAQLDGTNFGVDFNPVPDRLRVVSNTGQNLRINVDTGATTTDATLNPGGSSITNAAYTNSFSGADTTALYVLDSQGDRLMLQGQPSGNPNNGDLVAVGALGVGDIQAVGGFDIAGSNNGATAALNLAGAATSDLFTVNLTTGAATRINTIGGGEIVRGFTLATAPTARVYGITADARLVGFKVTTPGTYDSSVAITGLAGDTIVGADFRPANGQLVALGASGRTYRINVQTGAAVSAPLFLADPTDASAPFTALSGTAFGVDFNPTVDRLRTVSDIGLNLRSNVDTGLTTTDGTLARGPFSVTAAAYTNSFPGTTATALYGIDTRNDRLLVQNPPNDGRLVDVGALGVDAASVAGFDIAGPTTAVAALSTAANPAGFFTIDLTTGAATLVGNIGLSAASDRVTSIAMPVSVGAPAVNSVVYAVVNRTALIGFLRNAPGSATTPVAISGLQPAETVLGIDFRAGDGLLYALGSTGRAYTLDPTTATATLVSALAADVTDVTSPFIALDGVDFGVDFNPVADRLRVVSDTTQNLRIDVATGATVTDGLLNFPAPLIVAAAYTQSYAGATTTRLFDIDSATMTLQLQNPPNDGTLVTVGRLDPVLTVGSNVGFDIAGGDDGLALASMVPTGATQSTLYRINLRTGAATVVGPIGPSGSLPLNGLAINLQ